MFMKKRYTWMAALAIACGAGRSAQGQAVEPTVLTIDTANVVEYVDDVGDPMKFGLISSIPALTPPKGFPYIATVGDIVAVNGLPAKGTLIGSIVAFGGSPTLTPGNAISDITRSSLRNFVLEIQQSDGSPVGSITAFGLNGGTPPPGAPSTQNVASYTITGGTGAFLGARGQAGSIKQPGKGARQASMTEDPAYRRINGGGIIRFVLQVLPAYTPKIVDTPGGPAVTHSADFTLVTANHPAAPGEALSLFASGLGPTNPSRDAGKTFPRDPLATVSAPVTVTIAGKLCALIGAVGYPGTTDGYQINVQVPADVPSGSQELQLSSAWVNASPVTIVIR